ncbi:MAG: hypothetical protein QXK37_02730 [Candidatus Woesearchaeota archaeon]
MANIKKLRKSSSDEQEFRYEDIYKDFEKKLRELELMYEAKNTSFSDLLKTNLTEPNINRIKRAVSKVSAYFAGAVFLAGGAYLTVEYVVPFGKQANSFIEQKLSFISLGDGIKPSDEYQNRLENQSANKTQSRNESSLQQEYNKNAPSDNAPDNKNTNQNDNSMQVNIKNEQPKANNNLDENKRQEAKKNTPNTNSAYKPLPANTTENKRNEPYVETQNFNKDAKIEAEKRYNVPKSSPAIDFVVTKEYMRFLSQWEKAWETNRGYIDMYHPDFVSERGMTRGQYKRWKDEMFAARKGTIDVVIYEPKPVVVNDNSVCITFIQDYFSNHYSDRAKKELCIERVVNGEWKIVSEKSSETVRR